MVRFFDLISDFTHFQEDGTNLKIDTLNSKFFNFSQQKHYISSVASFFYPILLQKLNCGIGDLSVSRSSGNVRIALRCKRKISQKKKKYLGR